MIDFRLSSTDSKNLEGYIAKLRKKGFKVEKKMFDDTDARLFLFHNMSNRIILMDYEGKTTDDDEFIQNLNCSDVSLSAKFSIENRAFQKKFQPNGGVWRRLPIFLDKKSLY